jgi:cysteine-rich repeat protein
VTVPFLRILALAAATLVLGSACAEPAPVPDPPDAADEDADRPRPDADPDPDRDATADLDADPGPAPDSALPDTNPDGQGGIDVQAEAGGFDAGVEAGDPEDGGVPPGCGDGVVQADEACDDGNEVDTDDCRNDCTLPRCGDGVRSATLGRRTFPSPVVTDLLGNEGYVCDDGATCPESSCSVATDGFAPEHGICQALGLERAIRAAWGDGQGADQPLHLRAYNWDCVSFRCLAGGDAQVTPPCARWELLREITCEGLQGEECDDGLDNAFAPDACRPITCTLPRCGDGITDTGEQCDDGNRVNDDGCSNTCLLPVCGDGVQQAGEECDDGNRVDDDACRNDCTRPRCGDGVVQNLIAQQGFAAPVLTNADGVSGRVCDQGASCRGRTCEMLNLGGAPEHGMCQALGWQRAVRAQYLGGPGGEDELQLRAFHWACQGFVCGPGLNRETGTGCVGGNSLSQLTCQTRWDEACDLGDANANLPDSPCRTSCRRPFCGDGIVDTGEQCDDGNRVNTDACTNACTLARCGDGIVGPGEACDDGNDVDTDLCRNNCTLPVCGDGVVSVGETCDLGPLNSDAPDALCRLTCLEARCGDGIPDTGEECDDGNRNDRDLCTNACTVSTCGDGIRHFVLGEECDDGNRVSGDGCDADCLLEDRTRVGRYLWVGHDHFTLNDSVRLLLGNALAMLQRQDVRVAGFMGFADRGATGEPVVTDRVMIERAQALGIAVTVERFDQAGQIEDILARVDVLLIYEQETARLADITALAAQWAEPVRAFVDRGGMVMVTDFSGEAWRLASIWGWAPASRAFSVGSSVGLVHDEPGHPVLLEVSDPYLAASGTLALDLEPGFAGQVLVRQPDTSRAVVLYVEP